MPTMENPNEIDPRIPVETDSGGHFKSDTGGHFASESPRTIFLIYQPILEFAELTILFSFHRYII